MAQNGQPEPKKVKQWKSIAASQTAVRTVNPIRDLVDQMDLTGHPDKDMIPLSIGDPTVFGNLQTSDVAIKAVVDSVNTHKRDGYPHSAGYADSREAIAKHASDANVKYTTDDIVITSGCSGALDLAIGVLVQDGGNIVLPEPGFSLYKTLAYAKGLECRGYKLKADAAWDVDLDDLRRQIDAKTVGIVVTNPSNPCGSVYSEKHLRDIIAVAAEKQVPIIADEVYAHMVFSNATFHALASLATNVPVLTCGGIAKRFLVPGWRLGWVLIHDPVQAFAGHVRAGLLKLSQHILGANSIVQGALPTILEKTEQAFFDNVMHHLEVNAKMVCESLSKVKGVTPIMPQGAMYLMVGIEPSAFKDIKDDVDFTQKLLKEQSVFCLPAGVFGSPNYFRIVTTVPQPRMKMAVDRMIEFVNAHLA